MVDNCRAKAPVPPVLNSVSAAEHNQLRENGAGNSDYWTTPPDPDKPLLNRFRAEVKRYYFFGQLRRCCYCSSELQIHQGTYDAEHVLDRSTFPQFMFELNNLAAACKPCNSAKGARPALEQAGPVAAVPITSDAYRIVHPHLDEWHEHLTFDAVGRIVPVAESAKGAQTITLCGMAALNAARLSDHFAPAGAAAEDALRSFFKVKRIGWKRNYLRLLRELANDYNLAPAIAIVDRLEEEINANGGPQTVP